MTEPTTDPTAVIGRYDRDTEKWVAQKWDHEAKDWRDVVPEREASDDEVDAGHDVKHPGWATIEPSGTSEHHWVTFDDADDPERSAYLTHVRFHCDAPEGANCRWTCPGDCETFPCRHEPKPSDCWAAPWFEGNNSEDVMNDYELATYGLVENAVVDVNWEGDYATLSYRMTDRALSEDQKVVTR